MPYKLISSFYIIPRIAWHESISISKLFLQFLLSMMKMKVIATQSKHVQTSPLSLSFLSFFTTPPAAFLPSDTSERESRRSFSLIIGGSTFACRQNERLALAAQAAQHAGGCAAAGAKTLASCLPLLACQPASTPIPLSMLARSHIIHLHFLISVIC